MDKFHHFSAISYQAFCNTWKPAQGPAESWERLTQSIPQEVRLHLGICKGEKEDWKEKKTQTPTYVNRGFWGMGDCGRERKEN